MSIPDKFNSVRVLLRSKHSAIIIAPSAPKLLVLSVDIPLRSNFLMEVELVSRHLASTCSTPISTSVNPSSHIASSIIFLLLRRNCSSCWMSFGVLIFPIKILLKLHEYQYEYILLVKLSLGAVGSRNRRRYLEPPNKSDMPPL